MKKIFTLTITFFSILFWVDLTAQNKIAVPGKGNFTAEVEMFPGGGEIIKFPALRTRYFITDAIALRAGFEIDNHKTKMPQSDTPPIFGSLSIDEFQKRYKVALGAEYHILHNSRVSPYFGIDFSFERNKVGGEYLERIPDWFSYDGYEDQNIKTESILRKTNATLIEYPGGYSYSSFTTYENHGFKRFNAVAVAGADVYLTKHLYVGFELGLAWTHTKYDLAVVTTNDTDIEEIPAKKTTNFKVAARNGIRLGIWF